MNGVLNEEVESLRNLLINQTLNNKWMKNTPGNDVTWYKRCFTYYSTIVIQLGASIIHIKKPFGMVSSSNDSIDFLLYLTIV
jgi:hypothetical protein